MNKNEKLIDLINQFNEGNIEDLMLYFQDETLISSFLKKKSVLPLIKPFNANFDTEYLNKILYLKLNTDESDEILSEICENSFPDVIEENNEFYYVGDYSEDFADDLSRLFNSSIENNQCEDIANVVLSNDYQLLGIGGGYYDVYDNIISKLNLKNKEILKNIILKRHNGTKLEDGTIVNVNNIDNIIKDKKNILEIFEIDNDLENELHNVYNKACNRALYDEYFGIVINELKKYFNITYTLERKIVKVRILNFKKIINDFLFDTQHFGDIYNITYYQNFIKILRVLMSSDESGYRQLSFDEIESPNEKLTIKYLNEFF